MRLHHVDFDYASEVDSILVRKVGTDEILDFELHGEPVMEWTAKPRK